MPEQRNTASGEPPCPFQSGRTTPSLASTHNQGTPAQTSQNVTKFFATATNFWPYTTPYPPQANASMVYEPCPTHTSNTPSLLHMSVSLTISQTPLAINFPKQVIMSNDPLGLHWTTNLNTWITNLNCSPRLHHHNPARVGESHLRQSLWTSARPSSTSCANSSTCNLQLLRRPPLPTRCLHRTLTPSSPPTPLEFFSLARYPIQKAPLHILPCPAVQAQNPRDRSRWSAHANATWNAVPRHVSGRDKFGPFKLYTSLDISRLWILDLNLVHIYAAVSCWGGDSHLSKHQCLRQSIKKRLQCTGVWFHPENWWVWVVMSFLQIFGSSCHE